MDLERRRVLQYLAMWSFGSCVCCGCRTVPMTNRKQMLLMPEDKEVAMGLSAYEEVKTKEPESKNPQYIALVTRVGQRIAQAANKPDYKWEFHVIADDTQNAFCLPGGKVAVYEGIIPVCGNEAGLAVVMSHEISHALARHGGERMSQNYAVEGAKQAVQWMTRKESDKNKELVMQAYGVGTKYGVLLPYSRKHESEADHMGIELMARAGYDPSEAPKFWTRFGALNKGDKPAEFMSTHPSDDRRAKDLEALLPEAGQMYAQAREKYGTGEVIAVNPTPRSTVAVAQAPAGPAPVAGQPAAAGARAWGGRAVGGPGMGPQPTAQATLPQAGMPQQAMQQGQVMQPAAQPPYQPASWPAPQGQYSQPTFQR